MSSTGPNYARKLHLVVPWEILVFHNAVSLILVDKYSLHSRDLRKHSYPALDLYLSTSIYLTAS
eukprot:3610697-Ditylum_brightwellii.AAC.1